MFFFLFIAGIWALFGGLAVLSKAFSWRDEKPRYFIVPPVVATGLLLFALGVTTANYWDNNVTDVAAYRQIDNHNALRDEAMNKNLPEFRTILVDMYPQHEQEIFRSISSRQADWLWEKYPEMRAAETMQRYVSEVNSYTTWTQEMKAKQLEILARIEARKNTPWAINWLIPTINNRVSLESD